MLPIREDLADLEPYVSPQQPARYRMNTNESPYSPPESLMDEVGAALRGVALNRYPDRDASALFEAISEHVGWPKDGLWVANGFNEVFLHLFLGFGGLGRKALVFEPTYSLHTLIPRVASTEVVQVPRDDSFVVDVDAALDAIERERPAVTILCSPNNPTGTTEPTKAVAAIAEASEGWVVVDRAYSEFSNVKEDYRLLLEHYPNLIVTKTFSKAWRLAGIRIGYMLASPKLISELSRVKLPYHLSAITQIVGEAALRHIGETMEVAAAIARERERIEIGLQQMGVKMWPSDANFVLFEVGDANRVWEELLQREVLVRRYPGAPRLASCLRVTAGLPEETDTFLTALAEVLDD